MAIRRYAALAGLFASCWCALYAQEVSTKSVHEIVDSHIYPDGELYFYFNSEGIADQLSNGLVDGLEVLPPSFQSQIPFPPAFIGQRANALLQTMGVNALQGVGMSLHTRPDGLKEGRTFFSIQEFSGYFKLLDTPPLDPVYLSQIPVDADIAFVQQINAQEALPLVRSMGVSLLGPSAEGLINQQLQSAEANGIDLPLILQISGLPVIFWMKTWDVYSEDAEGNPSVTPAPKIGLIVPRFNPEVFELLKTSLANEYKIEELSSPDLAQAFTVLDDEIPEQYRPVFAMDKQGFLRVFLRHQFGDPVTPTASLVLPEVNPAELQAFSYTNARVAQKIYSVIMESESIPDEQKNGMINASNFYFPLAEHYAYRYRKPEGLLIQRVGPDVTVSPMSMAFSSPAMIAVLAAIAVPNFMEAQTRSKVSRTKAEMRSLSVALDSFMIDQSVYPPTPPEAILLWTQLHEGSPSYLPGEIPLDPFGEDSNTYYGYYNFAAERAVNSEFPNYMIYSIGPDQYPDVEVIDGKLQGVTTLEELKALEYDPSNGTVSGGDIIRFY
ncbi:MAG: type II secretion system protein GspG [Candidatus Sumerlaeia bacterium]|nr:type II secretion system protein GspG [Candidatus Sumerlaeia bacterium]